ncbi:hypothetical protein KDL29_12900 [bacterium]|nr:hypothetical protein [bacterium]
MSQEERRKWDHSNDPEYGQRLLGWIFRSHIWLLACSTVIGALVFLTASLFMPPRYGTSATIAVNKGGGGGSSLLSGLSLLGGAPAALNDEILTLSSREIGWQVIDELGLQVDIYDPQGPEAPMERVMGKFGRGTSAKQPRQDIYTRITISDVEVNPDMMATQEMWITADADGNWKLDDKSGANGEPVVGKNISFTPHFGGSHKAGYRYLLKVRPDFEAWNSYKESLTVGPAAPDSNVLGVRFTSYNPLIARQAVDSIVAKYFELSRSKTYDEYDNMLAFIDEQSDKAGDRIETLVKQIQDIQDETGLFNPAAQGEITVQRMSQIATQQTQNRIAIKQIDNVLSAMETVSPEELNDIIQAPATPLELENTLVTKLSQQITSLENHLSNKTEKHPDIVNLRNQIGITIDQIGDSLRSNRQALVLAENELGGDYGQLSSELSAMPEANSEMNILNAELKSLRDILEILEKQRTETNLAKVNASMDVSLMDEAVMPSKREKPAIGRNTALGGFAGLMLVVLVLLFRESSGNRFRTLKEVRSEVGLPVLAVLPGSRHRRRWNPVKPDEELAAQFGQLLFSSGDKLGLVFLPAGRPSWDPAAWLASGAKATLVDALPGNGLQALKVSFPGDESAQPKRAAADLSKAAGARYEGVSLPSGRCAVLFNSPLRWNVEHELAAKLDSIVLCVAQGACSAEELDKALAMLVQHGLSCRGVVVSNWSSARDIYGSDELNYVALSGPAA